MRYALERGLINNLVFPLDVNILLLGTFLTRVGYFMVWPYLAVILYEKFTLSASEIGFIFFFATFLSTLLSVYVSHKSDDYGRKPIIIAGLITSVFSFIYLAFCSNILGFAVCVTGIALGRAFIESCSKAYIGDRLKNQRTKELCQYFRYLIANMGVALGPFIGVKFGIANSTLTFFVTALLYFLYILLVLLFMVGGHEIRNHNTGKNEPLFLKSLGAIIKNKEFSVFLFCNTTLMIIYATFDSSLIQYLARSKINNLNDVIALLVIINSLTVIFLQLPVFYIIRNIVPSKRILLGILLITIAQLAFGYANVHIKWQLVIATLCLSIGEIIVMPTINVEVDRLAPEGQRGIAYGITNFTNFGTSASPLIGGLILQFFGGRTLFMVMFLSGLVTIYVYYKYIILITTKVN
ncbi:MFS transporter [Sodalis sp. RH22]|uniref:MFS transporter n=1 Tax=unclassified Sodalis (in: enterobacteria) TaxID=2636512 RepID=UPI0039B42916